MSKTVTIHYGQPSPASQPQKDSFVRLNVKADRVSLSTDYRSTDGAMLEDALRDALLQVVEYNHMVAMMEKRKERR